MLRREGSVLENDLTRVSPPPPLSRAARGRRWIDLSAEERRTYVMRLLDALEVTDRDKRLKVARAILYLAQGTPLPPVAIF